MHSKPILIKDLGMQLPKPVSKELKRYGLYQCPFCKKEFKAQTQDIKKGNTASCGCQQYIKKHNLCGTKFYKIWDNMIQRCTNQNAPHYKDYGGRGISVCEDWVNPEIFIGWASQTYIENCTLDRKNNNKGYSPHNCRWVDNSTQSTNQRIRKDNSSGYTGISKTPSGNKWRARIAVKGKQISLGHFENIEDAIAARDNYIKEYSMTHKLSSEER